MLALSLAWPSSSCGSCRDTRWDPNTDYLLLVAGYLLLATCYLPLATCFSLTTYHLLHAAPPHTTTTPHNATHNPAPPPDITTPHHTPYHNTRPLQSSPHRNPTATPRHTTHPTPSRPTPLHCPTQLHPTYYLQLLLAPGSALLTAHCLPPPTSTAHYSLLTSHCPPTSSIPYLMSYYHKLLLTPDCGLNYFERTAGIIAAHTPRCTPLYL